MIINNKIIFDHLVELAVIDQDKLKNAFDAAESQSKDIIDIIYDQDLATDEQIGQTVADLYSLPYTNLNDLEIDNTLETILSDIFAKKQSVVAFKKDSQGLFVTTSNPDNQQAIDFITKKTGLPVKLSYSTVRNIRQYWEKKESKLGESFESEISRLVALSATNDISETPIIELVDLILQYSEKNHASDIHVEPSEAESTIRFRIDSILHDVAKIPKSVHLQFITRLKVLSRLRIDEHQSTQDGKFQFVVNDGNKIDLRVSLTPITNGEKAVLRLLSANSRQFSLATLGIGETDLKKIESSYKKPFGMILSTGPTGSGKTTSLYAILKLINTREVNIMTIEDPVEYEIEGINQIQVNQLTNLTFAEGLRSIVRQDPNIILVGEIRDRDTAQIATQAALTGHLVLSTLHTNDAATTIPRLLEMGIEPFIIASSVNCIVAQRLVRQICQKCRLSIEYKKSDMASYDKQITTQLFGSKDSVRVYQGKGCSVCHNTGYSGRIGIFEVMVIDDSIREAIIASKSAQEISKLAISLGMTPMLKDGINKVLSGVTSLEEVLRVTKI